MGHLITSCRICDSRTKPFFNLGLQPLANSLLGSPDEKEKTYPLVLEWCPTCNLAQLNYTVDPKTLFSHYVWVTGTSRGARDFSEVFYKGLVSRTENPKDGYVLEVASNDGTFLLPFQRDGYEVLGVDPAENVVKIAEDGGVPTRCLFWNSENALKLKAEKGPARMIFARNVLAHVANTADFVKGLAECLHDDGVLAVEPHYAGKILEGLQYDSIYHEHLCYFTLKPIEHLLNRFGLFVFDVIASPISGGAIIVYAKKEKSEESAGLTEYREMEKEKRVNNLETWREFAKNCYEHREKLVKILGETKKSGKNIVGWGASARSSTVLNFCKVDSESLPAIIDMNSLKQGKFTAGSHIPIVGPEEGMARRPDTIFLTGWNFAGEIMKIAREKLGFKGNFIRPLPNEPKIIS
ncbi:MAG: class I SAM-dependent methyltransferase [Candidatus Jorgensenbacteria bacterium]